MRIAATALWFWPVALSLAQIPVVTETNVTVRLIAANLTSGNNQRYESPGLNILNGLKPDVVAIQEFNVSNGGGVNTSAAFRQMVDTAFGTDFSYFRETYSGIPNGVISRYPILASGSWDDGDDNINDRGFAWARIDLPGTNDLYVVSVHFKASSGSANETRRANQVAVLKNLIESNFSSNAWIVVAGDMNLFSETEPAITNLVSFVSDTPVPADQNGDPDTNANRNERYDRVLLSFSMTNRLVPVVLPSRTCSNGLVFDSRAYAPLTDVPPVLATDSAANGMQHMAVVKDLRVSFSITNHVELEPPVLALELPGILRWQGLSNTMYTILTSTNLADWTAIGSAISSTSDFSFTNSPQNETVRFYRVTSP